MTSMSLIKLNSVNIKGKTSQLLESYLAGKKYAYNIGSQLSKLEVNYIRSFLGPIPHHLTYLIIGLSSIKRSDLEALSTVAGCLIPLTTSQQMDQCMTACTKTQSIQV